MPAATLDEVVALCKRRGLIFPASEIYGGIANTYDYGHYGVLLKRNVSDLWWKAMIQERDDVVALDSAIIQHPKTWEASGHLAGFSDPLVQCLGKCKRRFFYTHVLGIGGRRTETDYMRMHEAARSVVRAVVRDGLDLSDDRQLRAAVEQACDDHGLDTPGSFAELRTIRFHDTDDDQLLAFTKTAADGSDPMLVVVNLDPEHAHAGTLHVDFTTLGFAADEGVVARDVLCDATYAWPNHGAWVRLDPAEHVAHVVALSEGGR